MTKSITLQSIFEQHLGDYRQNHKLDENRLKVCSHILSCHTPVLGGMQYQCEHCEHEVPLYHSCRDRHCPQCQYRATEQWRDKQQQSVLPVTYYHLVFSLPHELNGWVQLHPEIIYALLFQAVWKTLKAFGADKKRLNGKLGMIAVLHTWGQTLNQHVHLHCLNRTDSIIGYLARYTHRIAISNQRIIDMNNDQVRFSYKDYRDDQQKVMALDPGEFIRRFLLHVLPKGLMRIRHYGILANRCRKKSLKIIRKILAAPPPEKPQHESDEAHSYSCPKCKKGQLIFKGKIEPVTAWGHTAPS